MIYYRDPLLDKICDRILDLGTPAFIKNSELFFVAVNDAFAGLFNLNASDLVGTRADTDEFVALIDIEDKERACLVFGEDQTASFADPFGKGRFRVEMERFTLSDGQTFLYCIFGDAAAAPHPAPDHAVHSEPPRAAIEPLLSSSEAVDLPERRVQGGLPSASSSDIGLYRDLLNRLPVPAFARGADHRLAFVNQSYADLFGVDVGDLLGTTEEELLGEHAPAIWQANHDTLVRGIEGEREAEMPVAGGRMASTIIKTGRLVSENGTPYVVGTVIDISAMRQRELMLKSANDQAEAIRQDFENIVSSVDVGLIVLDRDLTIQLVNDAYRQRIWGRGADTWQGGLIGRSYRDLLMNNYLAGRRPLGFNDFEDYYQSRVAEIRSGSIESREIVFDDSAVTLYSGIKLSGGKFLLCYVDVSELRKRDYEVAQARDLADRAYRLVRNATDTMPEGLMVIEGDYIVFANPSLATIINVPEELLEPGGPWEDVFLATSLQNPDHDEAGSTEGLSRFREAMVARKDVSYNFPLDDERWVRLEMRSREEGQSVILCSDQTSTMRREAELKRLIARAEAADRAKSEFLGNMSLEIRTPMNGILGMAELLAKSPLDTRQKAFIEIIMKSGHALLTIINDILDFSKLDAGHMQLKYAPFDPGEALEDVVSLFASKAVEKDIELLVKRSGDIPALIMGDAGRFRQIITNLLSNAVKFTEQGHVSASIGVSSDRSGQTILTVMVEDTGIGIPADKLQTIFEKFSQIESSANRREGSGLGLAIAQRLAGLQGGAIYVHSSEGKGSTFTFTLSVQIAAEHSKPRPLPHNVEGARILVVDDHDVVRRHLLEHATEWGFECVGAADAATGLSILQAAADSGVDVDAVVIDYQMPETNGAELARLIRNDPRFDALSIILMTSHDIASHEKTVADIKIEAYLTKPIRIPLLRSTLLDVIRVRRARTLAARQTGGAALHSAGEPDILERELPEPPVAGLGGSIALRQPNDPYVLVAEDNEVNQVFFSQILSAAGIACRIVENGEEAVAAWQRATPSVILMDTTMPVLDGIEATRMIRAIEAMTGLHTPIIGVTSHAHDEDVQQCLAAGMDDHIAKPIRPERLEEKILHWAGQDFRPADVGLHLA